MVERNAVLVLLVSALGCTRGEDSVGRDPTSATASATAVATTTPSAALTTSAAPTAAVELPPLDTTCTKDDDCDHLWAYLVDGKCCKGTCSPLAASKAHVTKVEEVCAKIGYATENCPMKKCVLSGESKCRGGHCTIVKP